MDCIVSPTCRGIFTVTCIEHGFLVIYHVQKSELNALIFPRVTTLYIQAKLWHSKSCIKSSCFPILISLCMKAPNWFIWWPPMGKACTFPMWAMISKSVSLPLNLAIETQLMSSWSWRSLRNTSHTYSMQVHC